MFKKKKKTEIPVEKVVLESIVELLQNSSTTREEINILKEAKESFERKEYFPKIIQDLRWALTPIVVSRKSSKKVSEFYLEISSKNFMGKGLGRGLIALSGPGTGF